MPSNAQLRYIRPYYHKTTKQTYYAYKLCQVSTITTNVLSGLGSKRRHRFWMRHCRDSSITVVPRNVVVVVVGGGGGVSLPGRVSVRQGTRRTTNDVIEILRIVRCLVPCNVDSAETVMTLLKCSLLLW